MPELCRKLGPHIRDDARYVGTALSMTVLTLVEEKEMEGEKLIVEPYRQGDVKKFIVINIGNLAMEQLAVGIKNAIGTLYQKNKKVGANGTTAATCPKFAIRQCTTANGFRK